MTITLEDGRVFPSFNGEALAWSPGLYHTTFEERIGFPRMRAVLSEMKVEDVIKERNELIRDSFNKLFGHNAKIMLAVVEEELERRAAKG